MRGSEVGEGESGQVKQDFSRSVPLCPGHISSPNTLDLAWPDSDISAPEANLGEETSEDKMTCFPLQSPLIDCVTPGELVFAATHNHI